jgi:hypothetical protein
MNIHNSGKVELTMGDIERMQNRIAELECEKVELLAQVEQLPCWSEYDTPKQYAAAVKQQLDDLGIKQTSR